MCKGNCVNCKKAEFETTDVQVESLAERSGMIVDDGWISVHDMTPPKDLCVDIWFEYSDGEGRICNCFYNSENDDFWCWGENDGEKIHFDAGFVTHWQLLPSPPVK